MRSSRSSVAFFVGMLFFWLLTVTAQSQVTFFSPPTYTVVGPPLFVADFNGDGKLDLLGGIPGPGGSLQLGNGDGTFAKALPVQGTVLAVADFNGDGKPDLLEQGTGTLLVLMGKGDGTFQAPVSTNTGAGTLQQVAAGDLRGDGIIDVLGVYNNNLVVFLGDGNGTFAAAVSYPVGNTGFAEGVTVGDFNGDGKIDVAVSLAGNGTAGQEVVFLGNGDGTLQTPPKTSTGVNSPTSVVVGDFNGDGKLDLIMAGFVDSTCVPAQSAVAFLRGNGDGTFAAPTTVFCGSGSVGLVAADLNGDGKLDLVFVSALIQIYVGNGDGTFSNPYSYEPNNNIAPTPEVAVADFNQDGKLDLAAGGLVFLGKGNGSFQGQPAAPVPFAASCAVTGDFEKNGTQDVAIASNNPPDSPNLGIFLNDGSGVLTLAHTFNLQQPAVSIATADLNGDGNLDLIVANASGYSILLGNGNGAFQSPVFYPVGIGQVGTTILVADFNNDHVPDLAFSAAQGNSAAVLLGNGNGTFGTANYVFDGGGGALVAADFDGDGKLDLASSGGGGGFAILFGNGDGTFQAASFPPAEASCGASFAVDLNRDGKVDLVGGGIQVCLGNGDGTFKPLSPFGGGVYTTTGVSGIADINGDGIPDLVAVEVSGSGFLTETDVVFIGNGDGTFGLPVTAYGFNIYSGGTFELVADMNGDHKPDLVLGSQAGNVFLVANTTPPGFNVSASALSPAKIAAGNSATSAVTVIANFGFKQNVTLSCSSVTVNGSPATAGAPTCSFSPPSISNASGTSKLTIGTTASSSLLAPTLTDHPRLFYAMLFPVIGMALMGAGFGVRKKKTVLGVLLGCLVISGLIFLAACGGSSGGGGGSGGGGATTPAGNYTITVSGSAGSTVNTTTLTLVVQ